MEKTVQIVFKAAKNGGVIGWVGERPAFPDRRWTVTHPAPKVGEWWDVKVAGENTDKTVYFLMPVEKVPPPVWDGQGEVVKTLPDGFVVVWVTTRRNIRNTFFGCIPEYSFGDENCTVPLSSRSGMHHFFIMRAAPGTPRETERREYESRLWDSIIAEKISDVFAWGKYFIDRKTWRQNLFGVPLPNLEEGEWEEIFWKIQIDPPEDKKAKIIANVGKKLEAWWAEVQSTPRPLPLEEARRKAAELGGEYEERLWLFNSSPVWDQIARFQDGTWKSVRHL